LPGMRWPRVSWRRLQRFGAGTPGTTVSGSGGGEGGRVLRPIPREFTKQESPRRVALQQRL
ncbi:MAG: hypothetical protein LBG65_00850, partial [Puniceicoccales bacterium]|nr:hypothetical protein [Puniceicoccales bacterium]